MNSRQIAFLREFRQQGWMAIFDSPFRLEAPGLRENGMIEGVGDSTRLSAKAFDVLREADAEITRNVKAKGSTHA